MKKSTFGHLLPRPADIVKIDGNHVVDIDSDRVATGLIKANTALGGGYELVSMGQPRRKAKKVSK